MTCFRVLPLLIFILLTCSACKYDHEAIAHAQDPRMQSRMTLYRLDGDHYPTHPFTDRTDHLHGWQILQCCPINDSETQLILLHALDKGIDQGGGIPIDCYNPRHAIRLKTKTTTTDYLICFQCNNYVVWDGDQETGGGLISRAPQAIFNEVLENCIHDNEPLNYTHSPAACMSILQHGDYDDHAVTPRLCPPSRCCASTSTATTNGCPAHDLGSAG